MTEGSIFFEGRGAVHDSMRRITARLKELGIAYAVCGGLALFRYGFRQFCDDVDILVTKENIDRIQEELIGKGYFQQWPNARTIRDEISGVKIDLLYADYVPGAKQQQEVVFPKPEDASQENDGISYMPLPTLITLKIISGTYDIVRHKDIGSVNSAIDVIDLPLDFADQLAPSVRARYRELWQNVMDAYVRHMHLIDVSEPPIACIDAWDYLFRRFPDQVSRFEAMRRDKIEAEFTKWVDSDVVMLWTKDRAIARRHELYPEREFMGSPLP